jgi:hypothetical protein
VKNNIQVKENVRKPENCKKYEPKQSCEIQKNDNSLVYGTYPVTYCSKNEALIGELIFLN